MTTLDQIIRELEKLPEPLQQEVLDFAHYLHVKASQSEARNLMAAQQTSMSNVWNNETDDVWNDVETR